MEMTHMRKLVGSIGLLVALALTLGVGLKFEHANAAPATPAATGVEKQTLGQTETAAAPGRTLILQRRVFAPGSDSGAHAAAGPVVLYVESGSVTFSVVDGAALVTRANGETEQVNAGQSVTLDEYDTVTYDQGVVHDVANPGTEQAVTLESRLNPTASPVPATPAA
jgi:quercetin dioxygenase-like cupin family protein